MRNDDISKVIGTAERFRIFSVHDIGIHIETQPNRALGKSSGQTLNVCKHFPSPPPALQKPYKANHKKKE